LNEDLESTRTQVANEKARVKQLEAEETQRAQAKATADLSVQNAEAALEKNKSRIGNLPGEIAQAGAIQSVGQTTESAGKMVSDAEKIAVRGPQNQSEAGFVQRVAMASSGVRVC
jgi:hypothetical protein